MQSKYYCLIFEGWSNKYDGKRPWQIESHERKTGRVDLWNFDTKEEAIKFAKNNGIVINKILDI